MKAPRFLKEFASYAIWQIRYNEAIQDGLKEKAVNEINTAVVFYERGMITMTEAIDVINHPVRHVCPEEGDEENGTAD